MECNICCEKFNKSTRKPITCGCGFICCMNCCKNYLLSLTTYPKCMSCNRGWTPEFIITSMNKTFYIKVLRLHMASILLEREKSFLQDCQEDAEKLKKQRILTIQKKDFTDKIKKIKPKVDHLQIKYRTLAMSTEKNENYFEKIKNTYKRIYSEYSILQLELDEINFMILHLKNKDNEQTERKKFIMHCRTQDCKGFLSIKWKCDLCEKYTCKECLSSIGSHENKDNHVCKEEEVESAKAIKEETKRCPTCGVPIFRIHGCNNMWCTACKVGFNWRTLKIHSSNIDNPHYYEWNRNNGGVRRQNGDLPCGGIIEFIPREIERKIKGIKGGGVDLYANIQTVLRGNMHIYLVTMPRYAQIGENKMRDLRIAYLLNDITEEQWLKKLTIIQKTNSFRHCITQILDMYVNTMIHLYINLTEFEPKDLKNEDWLKEACFDIFRLLDYSNKELIKIGNIYNQVPAMMFDQKFIENFSKCVDRVKENN